MEMSKQLTVTFSDNEIEQIEKICDKEFWKTPAFIRHAVLKRVKEIEDKDSSTTKST